MTRVKFYEDTEDELHSEIEKITILSELPERWTYPDIQPAKALHPARWDWR